MIAVTRCSEPAVIARLGAKWLRVMLAATNPAERTRAQSRYNHPEIREALGRMFHGKCAYCESKTLHVTHAQIEHFRPKSRFSNQTFVWGNLVLACGVCNSARYKGDRFPNPAEGGPLLDPCTDNPEQHLRFHFDPVAELASVYGKSTRGETTVEILGLNRFDLRRHRSKHVIRLMCLVRFAQTDPEARRLLDEASHADAEYAAFARALLRSR